MLAIPLLLDLLVLRLVLDSVSIRTATFLAGELRKSSSMEDFFRTNFANLKGSEAKVLFMLLELGVASMPTTELMRLTGLTDRKTFYAAMKNLEQSGWTDWLLRRLGNPPVSRETPQPLLGNPTPPVGKPPTLVRENPTPSRETPQEVGENPTEDFETALANADDMDGSGDERLSSSPFQKRRKQQTTLLGQAWLDLFGEELSPITAKELVQSARSQALDVYHAMQQAKDRSVQYPKAYVRKVLSELAKKPPVPSAAPDLGDGRPVTEAMRKSWARAEALAAKSGLLDGWDLD